MSETPDEHDSEQSTVDDWLDLAAVALMIAAIIPGLAWSGYFVADVWLWFIVPLGLQPIGMWHAAGVGLTVKALAGFKPGSGKRPRKVVKEIMMRVALMPPLMWGLAWVVHLLMS